MMGGWKGSRPVPRVRAHLPLALVCVVDVWVCGQEERGGWDASRAGSRREPHLNSLAFLLLFAFLPSSHSSAPPPFLVLTRRQVVRLELEPHLNTCFRHFVLFTKEFGLVEERELAPLAELIARVAG